MPKTFSLTAKQRDELLHIDRKDPDPELRFRAHILLLLGAGYAWDTIEAMLFCSSRTVDRWLKRFQAEGVEGLTGRKRGRPFRFGLGWVAVLVSWVTTKTPRDFGCLRSRWSCAVPALRLRDRHGVTASRETVRRWLHRGTLVYRRPRPASSRTRKRGRPSWPNSGSSWRACRTTRRRSGSTRSRSTPTPRSGRCGCSGGSRPRSRRRGPTRSGTCRGRSTGGPARCSWGNGREAAIRRNRTCRVEE